MELKLDFSLRPILVFWETTKACKLKCNYCRAEAIEDALPGELLSYEAKQLIYSMLDFGRPYPILILTGGDPLMRRDIYELISFAKNLGINVAVALSVTPKLNKSTMEKLKAMGVKTVSISLDGGVEYTHDSIRGVEGHYKKTVNIIDKLVKMGFKVQVNTVVLRENIHELPQIMHIIKGKGVYVWEVFFPIKVGRGLNIKDISPFEFEDILHFLYDASKYGIKIRTVEAPFFRRVVTWRRVEEGKTDHMDIISKYKLGTLYIYLYEKLADLLGKAETDSMAHTVGTRDGDGVIFVAYNGDIYPSGFSPYTLDNIRKKPLPEIYRNNIILRKIRNNEFKGKCGYCEYKNICGGSRARALAEKGDILEEDPACIYIPRYESGF